MDPRAGDGRAAVSGPGQVAPGTGEPGVVETHVSVLVFGPDRVLKFKKPVRLPFVDLTAVEARRRACEEEVRANRRLSPDVYLGVADVVLPTPGAPALPGGEVLDHAVVMRRLPDERRLGRLVRQGTEDLGPALVALAGRLAAFHAAARRGSDIDEAARPEALVAIWQRSLDTLEPFAGRLVDAGTLAEVGRLALRYLEGRGPLLGRRIAEGRICDGHGDLLADDVFLLGDGPRVLDCIDFDPALRHVDVVADVAFLAMDLERLGAPQLAETFLSAYEGAAGERFPESLVHHYLAQRAAVRAEVACLRAAQPGGAGEEAAAQLELAASHLRQGRVILAVVCGLPGAGKSTLARALGERLGWPVLRSDEVRRALVAPRWRGPLTEAALPGAYDAAVTARTYGTMLERARAFAGEGRSVLVDATFGADDERRAAECAATSAAAELVVLHCRAPRRVREDRMAARSRAGEDVSGADAGVACAMAAAGADAPWQGEFQLDTGEGIEGTLGAALAALGHP